MTINCLKILTLLTCKTCFVRSGAQRLARLGVHVPETTATGSGERGAPRWRDRSQVKSTASTRPPCPQQVILLAVRPRPKLLAIDVCLV